MKFFHLFEEKLLICSKIVQMRMPLVAKHLEIQAKNASFVTICERLW